MHEALIQDAQYDIDREAVPLGALSKMTKSTSPLSVNHDGLFPAVLISFNLAPAVSLEHATGAIERMHSN
jgi:multidrug efflux pump subunit AcrB